MLWPWCGSGPEPVPLGLLSCTSASAGARTCPRSCCCCCWSPGPRMTKWRAAPPRPGRNRGSLLYATQPQQPPCCKSGWTQNPEVLTRACPMVLSILLNGVFGHACPHSLGSSSFLLLWGFAVLCLQVLLSNL